MQGHALIQETDTLPLIPAKKIFVLSLDMDGCILHAYHRNSDSVASSTQFIETNDALLTRIAQEIVEGDYDEVITLIGSNRQDWATDFISGPRRGMPSCFPILVALTDEIQKRVDKIRGDKKIHCHYDGFLLADVYGKRSLGENFAAALSGDESYQYSLWIFDDTKLSVLYGQLHHLASKNKDAELTFAFYDDRWKEKDILDGLAKFFSKHTDLMPNNLSLSLRHYEGSDVSYVTQEVIRGGGEIDHNYQNNIIFMTECAGYSRDNYNIEAYHLHRFLYNTCALERFKRERFVVFSVSENEKEDEESRSEKDGAILRPSRSMLEDSDLDSDPDPDPDSENIPMRRIKPDEENVPFLSSHDAVDLCLGELLEKITELSYQGKSEGDTKALCRSKFIAALNCLSAELKADIQEQEKKGKAPKDILNSEAGVIANKTSAMLDQLMSASTEKCQDVLQKYERECLPHILCRSKFARAMITVFSAAIGFAVGAMVGGALGYAAGSWTGPGAVVPAVYGLVKGGLVGTSIGVVMGGAASCLMFKPNQKQERVQEVVKQGQQFLVR